jgi:cbb3-type cytochrome oxidase subunit 3
VLLYEIVMVGLAPAIILVCGIAWLWARRRRQERRYAAEAIAP